jgi:gentisate 1,2-dioxygenase
VIWADLLDWPLLDFLSATWVRSDTEHAPRLTKPDLNFSERFYGHGGIKPLFPVHPRGEGQRVTPMFHIRGTDILATLKDFARYDGDAHEGIIVELVDPMTGEPAFPTLSHRAQLLRPGERTLPFRHTASTVYCVMEGSGRTDVDGEILEWTKNDFFVVPSHRWREHINTGPAPAVLYSYTDMPLLSKIGLYRAQHKSANGQIADIR